jgi:Uma2 family endonuclease
MSASKSYELMDGELHVTPAPSTTHQAVAQNIEFMLMQHVRETRAGRVFHAPLDVVLGDGARRDVVQPDILFIDRAREHIITEPEVAGAPDLAIEILSPTTKARDPGLKNTIYARAGVREYWIVDPAQELVDVFTLGEDGYGAPVRFRAGDTLLSGVLAGLRMPLADVFTV